MKKKLISLCLALVMVLSLLPVTAFAAEENAARGADRTPPVLTGMTLSTTEVPVVTGSGFTEIEITMSATDEGSGAKWAEVSFWSEETGTGIIGAVESAYWDDATGQYIPYDDGKLHGTMEIGPGIEPGTYTLNYVYLFDNVNNEVHYRDDYENWKNVLPIPDSIAGLQFHVTASGTPDGTPPVLTGMTLSATTVSAPNTIEVIISATDDVSGASWAEFSFYCKETNDNIGGYATGTYWDDSANDYVSYPDGNLHGTIEIDKFVESGTFLLQVVYLCDNADNGAEYSAWSGNSLPDSVTGLKIAVVEGDTPDGDLPVLTNMTLSATEITAPDTIDVIISASDDVSGVSWAEFSFYCEETSKSIGGYATSTYWDSSVNDYVPYPDGNLHGTIEIDQYVASGSFSPSWIYLCDEAGNGVEYSKWSNNGIPDSIAAVQFHVTDSGTPDITPPVLTDLDLSVTTMTAPGTIDVTVSTSDDVSGAAWCEFVFICAETNKGIGGFAGNTYWDDVACDYVPYPDGKLHGKIEIDQYVVAGTFELQMVYIYDNADNGTEYSEWSNTPIPDSITERQINVLNAVPDVTTSVAKPEFVDQIKDANDDAYIVADFSGEATLPETAFDAISGTDKTLDLVSEGVTWRFNGNDIVNDAKPIDLNVEITKVEENDSASGQEIQEKLEETPGVVMKFAENGELPGKATIQVKVDYAMREYLGSSDKLCVYYYNNQTGQLELVAENLVVVNDTYVEFSITHCSYYVLTTKTVHTHSFGEWETILAPTEATEGEARRVCACGEEETKTLPKLESEEIRTGDASGDGVINNVDAMLILQYAVGLKDADAIHLSACDVNGDGDVNNVDAMLILQYAVGLITEFLKK